MKLPIDPDSVKGFRIGCRVSDKTKKYEALCERATPCPTPRGNTMKPLKVALLAAMIVLTAGCNTLRIEIADEPIGRSEEDRHDYFLWGGFPSDVQIDLHEACPMGTAAIEESIRPRDAFVTLMTLTLWSPRTATYYCRSEKS